MDKNRGRNYDVIVFSGITPQSGSSVRIRSLCSELARRGLQVLLAERGRRSDRLLVEKGLKHVIFPTASLPPILDVVVSTLFGLRIAMRRECSLAFALKPLPPSVLPALALKKKGALAVIDVDDLDHEFHTPGMARNASLRWYRKYPKRFDRVTTHNNLLARRLGSDCGVDPSHILKLGQGIELKRFLGIVPDESLRRDLGLVGKKVVGYLASLGLTTDFGKVLPRLAEFVGDGQDRAVLVLGGGDREDEFRRQARALAPDGSIVFSGQLDHTVVPRYLGLCDAGFNYMEDTLANHCRVPIKAREYLAAGLPLVCNLVGDVPDLEDVVFFYKNLEEIPIMLEKALAVGSPEVRSAGRVWVEEHCDWSKIAGNFLEALPSGCILP